MSTASMVNSPPQQTHLKKKKKMMYLSTVLSLYALLAPSMILLFVFHYIPMYGIIIAFEDFAPFQGFLGSTWVGLKHFKYFLNEPKFWEVMKNTLLINGYDILFGFTAPIIFALLANEIAGKAFKRTMQTVSYLPHFLSWIVVSGFVYQMLSPSTGMVNVVLTNVFGIKSIFFMTELSMFRTIVVIVEIWKNVGWSSILYFSVIAGIDTQLYDAAKIDGAGRIRQTIHITLPGMISMIVLLFLLRISSIFSIGFERIFLLQNSIVYPVSDVISTYTYRLGIEQAQFSLTTAISLTQSLLGFTLLVTANKLSSKFAGLGLY